MSSASSSGSSHAAKWPPQGISVQRHTSYARSTHSRGGFAGASAPGLSIQAHRGPDRLGRPVEHYLCEHLVPVQPPVEVTPTVAPASELLDDPGGEAHRRIIETIDPAPVHVRTGSEYRARRCWPGNGQASFEILNDIWVVRNLEGNDVHQRKGRKRAERAERGGTYERRPRGVILSEAKSLPRADREGIASTAAP